ncbi:hypothetical protein BCR39DRAFT_522235 [Naematelia encephala]|uniref:DNA polymerase kappa n=1 Tax=Naematelia encephala TaxID=71784 RepID=A0A1Y2BDM5_9TREE|nr:hypothetical protein BCR39DRAFT_522235 [Naematelia encephala]
MTTSPPQLKGRAVELRDEDKDEAERRRRSFERSLAGPSVGKAGLMRDQTEVNRIIAEASKGSKFYNNQVRKDQELTEKIEWFQNKRDELMKTANRERFEVDADKILVEVEATRDLTQTIVHVDMDAFYASVEVKRDPSLKGQAFGVGQGVLTTASYEARKFGCRSGMAGFIAKKLCPHIILTPLNFDLYIAESKSVREVLLQYDPNLMMASLDEGYLNITEYMEEHNMSAAEVVTRLRSQVEDKTGLTMSAGIASNRMLAKICSDKNKPNGQFELEKDRAVITRFMRDLPVRKIPGFGRVTERCLEGLGVETCGDIYTRRAELLVMNHWFGFRGLCAAYLGIADNKVAPGKREERKSVGVERTFRDKTEDEDILATLAEIAEELEKDMTSLNYAGKTVTVKFKLHTFENKSRAQSVKKWIATADEILPIAQELLKKELPLRIRLLGIRMSTLKDLTLPDKGIRSFFTSPSKKGSSSSKGRPREASPPEADFIDLAQLDEEDEVAEFVEQQDPSGESEGELNSSTNLGKRSHTLGPVCPICAKALGPTTSNTGLNEHIDWCLNREAIEEAGKRTPKKPKLDRGGDEARKGRGRGKDPPGNGGMMAWLSKAK